MLKSSTSAKIAVDMIQKVKSLYSEGGLFQDEYRRDGVKDKDLDLGILAEKLLE